MQERFYLKFKDFFLAQVAIRFQSKLRVWWKSTLRWMVWFRVNDEKDRTQKRNKNNKTQIIWGEERDRNKKKTEFDDHVSRVLIGVKTRTRTYCTVYKNINYILIWNSFDQTCTWYPIVPVRGMGKTNINNNICTVTRKLCGNIKL